MKDEALLRMAKQAIDSLYSSIAPMTKSIEATVLAQQDALKQWPDYITPLPDLSIYTELSKKTLIAGEIAESMVKQSRQIEAWLRPQIDAMASTISTIAEQSLRWLEYEEKYRKAEIRYIAILCECGWPPLFKIPANAIHQFVKAYDDDKQDFYADIDRVITEFHDKSILTEMVNDWAEMEQLGTRVEILRQAVEAHIDGKYLISIPALLAQVEGIIASIFGHEGYLKGVALNGYIDLLIEEDKYSPVKTLIVNELYEVFLWGSTPKSGISRNAILHGSFLKYGSEKNSLKVILILDFLITIMKYKHATTENDNAD